MMIDLTERELEVIKKVLKEKAIELRSKSDYYQNDGIQADYFEVDVLARKLEVIEKFSNKDIEKENTEYYGKIKKQMEDQEEFENNLDDEWDMEI